MTLRTAQGGRSRNAKRPGALTGIDLAESADCPSMSSGKGSDAHGHGSALGAFATLSAAVVVAYLLPAGEDKKAGHAREPGFVYRNISDHRVFALAAGMTFYSLLAIFPALNRKPLATDQRPSRKLRQSDLPPKL